jgi:nucleoside-diphosphate-sugar epimerase
MTPAAASGSGVLVTSADPVRSGPAGLLGLRLAADLAERGRRAAVLGGPARDLPPGIELVPGDVADLRSLRGATAGREAVLHTAGLLADWGDEEEFLRVNVEGTRRVLAACREGGVRRLVHLSSLTVLGFPRDGAAVDETAPVAARTPDAYTRSRIAAEELVRQAHGRDGLETVVVRSGLIWGPGERTVLPRMLRLLREGRMILVDGGCNLVALSHVANLAAGMLQALEAPQAAGEVFHLTDGEEVSFREVVEALAAAAGLPPPRRSLPFPVVWSLAFLAEAAARIPGRPGPPPLTRYGVRMAASHGRYRIDKARRMLGYRPLVGLREGMARLGPGRGD